MPDSPLHEPLLRWYAQHARDLPWRRPGVPAWDVLVSEVMLQQTPVVRVLPAWAAWTARWPTVQALAAAPSGEAVRQWGKLGYPRRALRLHAAAQRVVEDHNGRVPADLATLRTLPGVGAYTAAAVASFAFGQRHVVLDVNVRRVLARAAGGVEPGPALTRAEQVRAEQVLPDRDGQAALWSVAVMELGALVCTARAPRCPDCPLAGACRWLAAGRPGPGGPSRRAQSYAGTDRQVRGRLLDVLRAAPGPVPRSALDQAWEPAAQRERALASLLTDGLLMLVGDDRIALP